MAYISKRTGKEVDELLDKVEHGGTGGGASITIDKELSPTSDNAIANSAVVNGLAGLAEGVSEAIGNVAKNVEQNTADIKTKQDTLTLTTKPNGNIVIGNLAEQSKEFMPATPSGDPMHYAYEAVGATYNSSGTDKTFSSVYNDIITHKSSCWRLHDLGDLTNEQMSKIYNLGRFNTTESSPLGYGSTSYPYYPTTVRANIARNGMYNGTISNSYFASTNYVIETINLSINVTSEEGKTTLNPSEAFTDCRKLKSIIGVMALSSASTTNSFKNCYLLKNVKITGLNVNISFAHSPLLSKESLLYMINKCASSVSFTITLHPDVYAKCTRVDEGEGQYIGEWWDEIDDALGGAVESKNTKITLASA